MSTPELIHLGYKIVPEIFMSDYSHVRRSWKERMLTWPWKPWRKWKSIHDPRAYILPEQKTIYVTHETFAKLQNGDITLPADLPGLLEMRI